MPGYYATSGGGGGGVTDNSVYTAAIQAGAVTFAKIADIATDRLVGRDTAGTGSVEVLTVGGGIEFTGSGGIQRAALTGAVTASAGSNTTAIASNSLALAKLVNAGAQYDFLMRNTSGAGAWEDVTLTNVKAALGISDPLYTSQMVVSSAAVSSTSATYADITGVTFQPVANGIYLVEFWGIAYTAATTTGWGIQISATDEQYGAAFIFARGGSQSTQGLINNAIQGAIGVLGTSAPTSPLRVPAYGWAYFKAAASAPSACKVQFASEVGGSQVDIAIYDACMRYRRLA